MKRRLAIIGRLAVLTALLAGTSLGAPIPAGAQTMTDPPFFAGEVFDDAVTPVDNIVLLFYGSLDQASVPAGSAFVVTIDSVPQTPVSVTIPYVMYEASPGVSLSAVRLGLPTSISFGQTGTVTYTPPTTKPLTIGAELFSAFSMDLNLSTQSSTDPFTSPFGIVDEFRGRNHITALFTRQLTTGALPDPGDFLVTRTPTVGTQTTFSPTALSVVFAGFGYGFLDMKLPVPLDWDDVVTFLYTPGTMPLWSKAGTEQAVSNGPVGAGVFVNLGQTPLTTTPTGTNVAVAPESAPGVTGPIDLTFGNVTQSGTTYVTPTTIAPPPPAGYQIGSPPTYYDIQTTATYSGSITVCISFAGMTPAPTSLLHYQGGAWADITTSIDFSNQKICGVATSLSPFVMATRSFSIAGFSQPLNDPISSTSTMSVFKGGSTIPVKFAMTYPDGTRIPDSDAAAIASECRATISVARLAGTAPAVDEVVASTTPNSGTCFRYDAAAHQFIFNLGTKGLSTNAQYQLRSTVVGPSGAILAAHSLVIGLR